jgi:NAD-dependent DNA ligase
MHEDFAAQRAVHHRRMNKAMELLLGMVTGMVADDHLHDQEILLLNHWLLTAEDLLNQWPASVISQKVRMVLADGVITDEERLHLLGVLKGFAVADFAGTGQVSPSVIALPFDHDAVVVLRGSVVCHTGAFTFGTRAACEALTERAGGVSVASISRRTQYLVVGSNVSPDWKHTNYGRKIEAAVKLRDGGVSIALVSEEQWLSAVS